MPKTLHLLTKTSRTIPVVLPERGQPIQIEGQEYLTTRQAGKTLHLQPETIASYVRTGQLAGFKIGRKTLIRRSDLEAFAESHRVKAS